MPHLDKSPRPSGGGGPAPCGSTPHCTGGPFPGQGESAASERPPLRGRGRLGAAAAVLSHRLEGCWPGGVEGGGCDIACGARPAAPAPPWTVSGGMTFRADIGPGLPARTSDQMRPRWPRNIWPPYHRLSRGCGQTLELTLWLTLESPMAERVPSSSCRTARLVSCRRPRAASAPATGRRWWPSASPSHTFKTNRRTPGPQWCCAPTRSRRSEDCSRDRRRSPHRWVSPSGGVSWITPEPMATQRDRRGGALA